MNYLQFRERLPVPLVAVELSFDGTFELGPGDADVLIQLRSGDVMWQKERLLNIGVRHMPPECRYVALLDADVAFDVPDWPSMATRALESSAALQPFDVARFLGPMDRFDGPTGGWEIQNEQRPLARQLQEGKSSEFCLGEISGGGRGETTNGLAWVFRREVLERHGLFDASVIGGGDTSSAAAFMGAFRHVEQRHKMNRALRDYYRAWAAPVFHDMQGQITYLPGALHALWHGDLDHRGGSARHTTLTRHDFDPPRDLSGKAGEAWRWASDKPQLHQELKDYFAFRREDG